MPRVSLNCATCGKEFLLWPAEIKRGRTRCSMACFRTRITKRCENCGKDFTVSAHYAPKRRLCSRACRAVRIDKICQHCGKNYRVRKCESYSKYCSNVCRMTGLVFRDEQHYRWRGGTSDSRGTIWKRQRLLALKRDRYTCRVCGKTKQQIGRNPDVAHIVPLYKFPKPEWEFAHRLDNLKTLCRGCHIHFEYQTKLAFRQILG